MVGRFAKQLDELKQLLLGEDGIENASTDAGRAGRSFQEAQALIGQRDATGTTIVVIRRDMRQPPILQPQHQPGGRTLLEAEMVRQSRDRERALMPKREQGLALGQGDAVRTQLSVESPSEGAIGAL